MAGLLPSVHRLLAHLHKTGLRFAVGEFADGCNGLVGILLGQSTGLSDTVALVNKFTSLNEIPLG